MAAQWPPSLQQYLNQAQFSQSPQPATIRTEVETGPTKKRRRFTDPMMQMTCQIWIPRDDYPAFLTFYEDTLDNGSVEFDFNDPITGVSTEWRFAEEYRTRALGGLWFVVSMTWESLP